MQPSVPLHTSKKDRHMFRRRNRSFFTPSQIKQMEDTFSTFPFPDRDQIRKMSKALDISERSLQVWFQNRRARLRKANNSKKELHVSTEHLKSSSEPLKLSSQSNTLFPVHSTKGTKTLKEKTYTKPQSIVPKHENTRDTVAPIRIENCHVSWAPKSLLKDSIPSISDNRKHFMDKTDDYQVIRALYQINTGTDLEYTYSDKTPSPKSKANEVEELSPLNLCIRDSSSDVAIKPQTVTSRSIFQNHSTMYGCPQPLPCYPQSRFSPFYPPLFFPSTPRKLDGHMSSYNFPFSQEKTSDDLKS